MRPSRRLLLIRHGEVHPRWRGTCYGSADVGLSSRGRAQSRALVRHLASEPVTRVFSSGLRRADYLAERLAHWHSLVPVISTALRERDFGTWERRSWQEIGAETGAAVNGMVSAPDTWRPPRGETTFELRDRVLGWYTALPPSGSFVAVTHGGPIAVLLGTLSGCPVADWPGLVPEWGGLIEIPPAPAFPLEEPRTPG